MQSGQFLRPTLGLHVKGKDNREFSKTVAHTRSIANGLSAFSENCPLTTSCYHAIAVQHRFVGKICNEMFVIVYMVKFSNLQVGLY